MNVSYAPTCQAKPCILLNQMDPTCCEPAGSKKKKKKLQIPCVVQLLMLCQCWWDSTLRSSTLVTAQAFSLFIFLHLLIFQYFSFHVPVYTVILSLPHLHLSFLISFFFPCLSTPPLSVFTLSPPHHLSLLPPLHLPPSLPAWSPLVRSLEPPVSPSKKNVRGIVKRPPQGSELRPGPPV